MRFNAIFHFAIKSVVNMRSREFARDMRVKIDF